MYFANGIQPSRTLTSGSFESVRWNACLSRLHLSLHSHLKEFGGMESEPMLTEGKIPLYQMLREGLNPRHCMMQDNKPNTRPTELFWPLLHEAQTDHVQLCNINFPQNTPSRSASTETISPPAHAAWCSSSAWGSPRHRPGPARA